MKKLKVFAVLIACTLLLVACGNNETPKDTSTNGPDQITTNSPTKPPHTSPPKGWTQNPDSDFDYSYNSDLRGVEVRYIGTSPRVWFPTEMNSDPVVAIGRIENPEIVVEVYIPEGLLSIGYGAFRGCVKLENIIIPETVEIIDTSAFEKCTSLKTIYIPDSVGTIGHSTFDNCVSLESVRLPDHLTTLEEYTFNGCLALTQINLPRSLKIIGSQALSGCNLSSIDFPEGLETIGYSAVGSRVSNSYNTAK